MSQAETMRDELSRIGDIVVAARDLISDGQLINLNPLESEVSRICGEIECLNADQAAPLKPVLLALINDLDRLAGEMRQRQNEFEQELREVSSHSKAARAYAGGSNKK